MLISLRGLGFDGQKSWDGGFSTEWGEHMNASDIEAAFASDIRWTGSKEGTARIYSLSVSVSPSFASARFMIATKSIHVFSVS